MQSPRRPVKRLNPGLRDLGWLIPYSVSAARRLARARLEFQNFEALQITQRNNRVKSLALSSTSDHDEAIERITYVMARVCKLMPFKSDCLIQSFAAQDWLKELGLTSEMQLGVEPLQKKPFEAHAWLVHGDRVVTGGDIAKYELLLGDSQKHQLAAEHAESAFSSSDSHNRNVS